MVISIVGLDKADVLAQLFNHAKVQNMGSPNDHMSRERAAEILTLTQRFDWISHRVLKVNLTSDTEFDPYLYDRDNGQGAAEAAIAELRSL